MLWITGPLAPISCGLCTPKSSRALVTRPATACSNLIGGAGCDNPRVKIIRHLTGHRRRAGAVAVAALIAIVAGVVIVATGTAPPVTTREAAPATVATASGCPMVPAGPPHATIAANFATALAFTPDGRLFYTERAGTIRVVEAGVAHTFASVPTTTTEPGGGYSERGLLGLAISPAYTTDHTVYAMYTSADHAHEFVARWTDCGGRGTGMRIIITLPSGNDCCHKGGRLAFGPDGKLYVTLGEEHDAPAAQDTGDVRGKVLRYNPDGTVPTDNPFGAHNPVWAYGLRNPFGIAFSSSGTLMVTSNGPSGDAGSPATGYDLAITIARGTGHQWPLCYGYGHPIAPSTSCNGEPGPDWSSETDVAGNDTVVPTGATFVDASGPPGYAGHFVFCTYDHGMRILSPGSPHATVTAGPSGCTLDVKEGPNHALYFSDTGHIHRLG